LQYENELRGQHGIQQIEVDALGQEKKILSRDPYKLGNNLHLTIDAHAQRFMDESIMQVLATRPETNRAVGIAMDPQTGEILALSSLPTYDNNKFAQGISSKDFSDLLNDPDKPLFFRAIKGEYPSGSTFKIVMSAATLNEGIIKEYTRFLSNGGIRIGQWFFPDWKDGGHGSTDVKKALAESVNTFYYIIGGGYNDFVGIGARKIAEYARQYGLGEKLGIDLPNEASGFVPTPEWKVEVKDEPWYIGDTYHFSIGQGDLLVTPLQVASFTATVANGGTFYKPHMVKAIEDPNTMEKEEVKPELVRDSIVDEKSTQIVREGLRQGVTKGSGIRLNYLPYSISGKTGTAQWGGDNIPHAWFTSFAPYENPEIVVTILVEEGEGGTKTAVPIAEQFYKRWLEYKGKIELNTDI
jgi:penicillin-binding protein 2